MVNVSILLLALALVAVAISVVILGKRVSALEKEFACRPSISSLKAANRLQSFVEKTRSSSRFPDVVFSDSFPGSFEDKLSEL